MSELTERAIANLLKALEVVINCKFEKQDVILLCKLSDKFKETTDKLYKRMQESEEGK